MEKRRKREARDSAAPSSTGTKPRRSRRVFPPDSSNYGGEISAEAVKQLRADAVLGEGEWETVDGYVGWK